MLQAIRNIRRARGGTTTHAAVLAWEAADGPLAQAVCLPAAAACASSPDIDATALMRLRDGTVFMARVPGHAWTMAGVELAATALQAALAAGDTRRLAEVRLAAALGVPCTQLLDPALADRDIAQWPVQGAADALGARGLRAVFRAGALDLAAQLSAHVAEAARALLAGLDAKALEHAVTTGRLDTWVYNYLVHPAHGSYRMQFAKLYPLLLNAAALATPSGPQARLREAVDRALPLADCVARLWNVRPGVVRYLARKSAALVGPAWQRAPEGLARILHALPPERYPGSTQGEWAAFNSAVAEVRAAARALPWESPAALAWLRRRTAAGWMRDGHEAAPVRSDTALVESVERLREAFEQAILLEAEDRRARVVVPPAEVVVRRLIALLPRDLGRMAACFESALATSRAASALRMSVLLGQGFWPLTDVERSFAGGARRAVGLTSRAQLERAGIALRNCLGNERYALACRTAEVFVVLFIDTASDKACSAAQIRVTQDDAGVWRAKALHLLGASNKTAAPACAVALRELLGWCASPAGQAHIAEGAALAAHRHQRRGARRLLELQPLARALRHAVGDADYEAALGEVTGAAPGRKLAA
jgi:hypothetical protein